MPARAALRSCSEGSSGLLPGSGPADRISNRRAKGGPPPTRSVVLSLRRELFCFSRRVPRDGTSAGILRGAGAAVRRDDGPEGGGGSRVAQVAVPLQLRHYPWVRKGLVPSLPAGHPLPRLQRPPRRLVRRVAQGGQVPHLAPGARLGLAVQVQRRPRHRQRLAPPPAGPAPSPRPPPSGSPSPRGAAAAASPSGSPQTARSCCSNWLTAHASQV